MMMTEQERQEITAIVQRELLAILDEADSHIIVSMENDLGTIAKATIHHLATTIRDRASQASAHITLR
jgi:CMP-2-keto-3-deoxyoctulosonic acid synthetase